jgi:glycosyltransferase involved in cell wall biosynthesis
MKTVLITAYAINPFKGSEDGTGWNIAKGMSKEFKSIVITRKNNREHIERYLKEQPDLIHNNMSFYYFDLPNWAMFWKKKIGERGYVLYFYLWQFFITFFISRNKLKFDLAHNLNFHSDSHPTFLWFFRKPTIWGPIGHHPKVPKAYLLPIYGRKAYLKDRLYFVVKWMMRNLDPFYRLSIYKSTKIIAINSSIQSVIRAPKNKMVIIPAVAGLKVEASEEKSNSGFTILSVGRFVEMKGFELTIKSFARFLNKIETEEKKKVQLKLVGKGELTQKLKDLTIELGIEKYVKFITWVEKSEMETIYAQSDAFLFPSHEGAGMVVPEAMSYGLPVITFDNVGPGELLKDAGIKIPYSTYSQSVLDFSDALTNLYNNPGSRLRLGINSSLTFKAFYTWEKKIQFMTRIYNECLEEKSTVQLSNPIKL